MLTALGVAKLLCAGPELQSYMCGTETKPPNPKSWAANLNVFELVGEVITKHVGMDDPIFEGFKLTAVWHTELQQSQGGANSPGALL